MLRVELVIAGLLIFWLYKIIQTYMLYRKSKQDDQEMFPKGGSSIDWSVMKFKATCTTTSLPEYWKGG